MPKSSYITVLIAIFVVSSGSSVHSARPRSLTGDPLYRHHRYNQPYRPGSNVDHRRDLSIGVSGGGTTQHHLSPLEVRVNRNRHFQRRDRVPKFLSRTRSPTAVGSDRTTENVDGFRANIIGSGSVDTLATGNLSAGPSAGSSLLKRTKNFRSRVQAEEKIFRGLSSHVKSSPEHTDLDDSRRIKGDSTEPPMGLTKLDEMLQRLENNNEQLMQQLRRERDGIAVSRLGHHHHHGRHATHRHHGQRQPLQLQDDLHQRAMSPRDATNTAYELYSSSVSSGNYHRTPPEHRPRRTHYGRRLERGHTRSETPSRHVHAGMNDFAPRLDLEGTSHNTVDFTPENEATIVEDADYQDEEAMSKGRKATPRVHQQTLVDPDSNSLRLASENVRYVITNAQCLVPVRRCIDLSLNQTAGGKTFWPRCAIVNRCGEESGCCYSPGHVCSVKESHSIDLYFFYMTHGPNSKTGVERLQFDNHTKCECKPRDTPYDHTTVRPQPTGSPNPVTRTQPTPGSHPGVDDRRDPTDRSGVDGKRGGNDPLGAEGLGTSDDRHSALEEDLLPVNVGPEDIVTENSLEPTVTIVQAANEDIRTTQVTARNEYSKTTSTTAANEDMKTTGVTTGNEYSKIASVTAGNEYTQTTAVTPGNEYPKTTTAPARNEDMKTTTGPAGNEYSKITGTIAANEDVKTTAVIPANDYVKSTSISTPPAHVEETSQNQETDTKYLNALENHLSRIEGMQYASALRQPPPSEGALRKELGRAAILKRLGGSSLLPANLLKSSPAADRARSERAPRVVTKSCKCPDVYMPSAAATTGECECVCDSRRGICRRLMKGKRYFKAKDEKCIMSGECGLPACQFGDFIVEYKRCPRKREMKKLRNKGGGS